MGFMQATQVAEIKSSFGDAQHKVHRQMLAALTLLLAALVLVLVKDRDFWFPSAPVLQSESEPIEEAVPAPNAKSETAGTITRPVAAAPLKKKAHVPPVISPAEASPAAMPVRTGASRAALPPLQVEVVAGDEHRPVQGGSNSVKVDLQPGTPTSPTQVGFRRKAFRFCWRSRRRGASPDFSKRYWNRFTFSRTRLSSAGKTNEGRGLGRAECLDRAGRQYPEPPGTQRPHHSFCRSAGSGAAMAIQTVLAVGPGGRN